MRISSTKTSENAAANSVPLMLSNTLMASAAKPPGPVTLASSPPPGSDASSRSALTGSRIVSDSPSPVMVMVASAAVPSRDGTGSDSGVVAANGASPAAARCSRRRLKLARSSAITCRSAAVRPPSRR